MTVQKLVIDIRSYWHAGGGRGGGAAQDAIVHRDADNFPILPGRHLKGLLRDALEAAEAWGWDGYQGLADTLFGDRTEVSARSAANSASRPLPGCLRVSSATLPPDTRAYLLSSRKDKVPLLFRTLYATAVRHDRGVASDKSLRGIEVAVPMELEATIEQIGEGEGAGDWPEKLEKALILLNAVGGYRKRGLGRARMRMEVLS